ncbi:hypothetical protein D3C78_1884050 [compost metagenome]
MAAVVLDSDPTLPVTEVGRRGEGIGQPEPKLQFGFRKTVVKHRKTKQRLGG